MPLICMSGCDLDNRGAQGDQDGQIGYKVSNIIGHRAGGTVKNMKP